MDTRRGGGPVTTLLVLVALAVASACSSDDGGTGDDDRARTSSEPAATTADPAAAGDLTLVDLNMLHGLTFDDDCPAETESCRAAARLELLWDQIAEAGCPGVITLQEVGPAQLELLPTEIADLCDGEYEVATEALGLPVEVAILTRLPVLDHEGLRLSGINWAAQWVQVDSELGPADIVTAHFASSSDPFACEGDYCADLCPPGGFPGDCHPLEILDLLDRRGDPQALQIVTGDLNRPVTDPRVTTLLDAGFVDAWTTAGNPECDPTTGEGCTCCVGGEGPLVGLDQPEQARFDERIDFVLVRAPDTCEVAFDGPDDDDADGTGTGPFARMPRAEALDGVLWSSDHSGVQADIACTTPQIP